MKRTMCMAAAFLCAAAMSASAQTPTTATTSTSMDKSSDKITVTGCLTGGAESSSTTASSSTASSGMSSYVLTTTPMTSSDTTAGTSGSTTAGTTATTGTTDSAKMAHPSMSYMLDGRDAELKAHVGHRIEVMGTVAKGMDHGDAPAATSTTTSGSASDRMSGGHQMLKVSSVRMISANCSAK